MMYLLPEHWSARYDDTFFTIKILSKEVYKESPDRGISKFGHTNFPATYYSVHVYNGNSEKVYPRRFSQFKWLYDNITANPPLSTEKISKSISGRTPLNEGSSCNVNPIEMPPKGIFCFKPDEEERQEDLKRFIEDLLVRPGYAAHPAVIKFFEL